MGDVADLLFGEAIGQQQHRRAFQRSTGNAIQRIHQPWALGGQHHTGCTGHFRIRHRHHRRIAFMPRQNEANAKTLGCCDDIQRGATPRHAIDALGAAPRQRRQQILSGVHARARSGQKRTPARARPPPRPIAVPSARQQAAPSMLPSALKAMAFIPPPTCGMGAT